MTAAGVPAAVRRRPWRSLTLALIAICGVAAVATYFTAPRPGGQMDPDATGPQGAHALVQLLRDRGVPVVIAHSVDEAQSAARPGTLLLVAQTQRLVSDSLLARLADTPSDLLLVEPTAHARAALAPGIRTAGASVDDNNPNCALPEAHQAGAVDFGPSNTFRAVGDHAISSCYGGALVRYRDGERVVTVVGSSDFMTNGSLLRAGNAALALNLAGQDPRVIWYAPQHLEGGPSGSATIYDLMPDNVTWIVLQLAVTVVLVALWKGRRIGPLVAEDLPVVVRASETVEGHGRLYRSRQARDRAAQALRVATLQRVLPRLGLGPGAPAHPVVLAVAQRTRTSPELVQHILFGPLPVTDPDLTGLARALDDIERQILYP